MIRAVRESLEVLDALPHREVDNLEGVSEHIDVSGVAQVTLQPPYETGRFFGQCVDPVELVEEPCNSWVFSGMFESAYVQLGEVVCHLAERRGSAW